MPSAPVDPIHTYPFPDRPIAYSMQYSIQPARIVNRLCEKHYIAVLLGALQTLQLNILILDSFLVRFCRRKYQNQPVYWPWQHPK